MRTAALIACLLAPTPALALTAADANEARYDGGTLPDGQSPLTVRLQVLLDRAGVSPGVIDGYKGGMTTSALRGFEAMQGLEVDGILDREVWSALGGDDAAPVLVTYTVTEGDVTGLTDTIPDHVAKKAEMDRLGYTRVTERLAERFHMDEGFLKSLNEGTPFEAGAEIVVADPGARRDGTAARIELRKAEQRAVVFDARDRMIANYPVAVGSEQTPSPEGKVEVTAVAMDPTYGYRPSENFVADGVEEQLTLPPGPNGPVGTVWIDLSKPTYGLHGTDTPAELFRNVSHGCVRFTNWDVEELAYMVSSGVAVEFVE